jgi:uncharacterized glyoxalase superfamily protein PhnB
MANDNMWITPDVVPQITYSDVPRALEWLERVFGFRERVEGRLSWSDGCLAWLEIGDSLVSLSSSDESWPKVPNEGKSSFMIKVYVDDIDSHFARAKSEGAAIVSPPTDGFWGGRIYRALDHERNRWEISQRGRDLAAELWQLPPDLTRGV